MTRVKVGLDQWAVADMDSGTQLLTNGLSGCVGLVLIGDRRFGLAHVFSACDANNWDAYEEQLSLMCYAMTENDAVITEMALVYSEEQPSWLATQLRTWLELNGVTRVEEYRACAGCRVLVQANFLDIYRFDADNNAFYWDRNRYVVIGDAGLYLHAAGGLSGNAADAD